MQRMLATIAILLSVIAAGMLLVSPLAARADDFTLSNRQGEIFATICARCHVRPGIGVPVVGDEDAWASRRAKGADVLLSNTIMGQGDMPPLGTCGFCSEDDLRRLVAFVAGLTPSTDEQRPSDEEPRPR